MPEIVFGIIFSLISLVFINALLDFVFEEDDKFVLLFAIFFVVLATMAFCSIYHQKKFEDALFKAEVLEIKLDEKENKLKNIWSENASEDAKEIWTYYMGHPNPAGRE